MQYFWVGIGGALGSVFRFFIQSRFESFYPGAFPLGTLTVNLAGSLAIGFLGGLFAVVSSPLGLKSFLLVGVLGGFTTFSTFAQGNLTLIRAGQGKMAFLYILSTNTLGIGLAFLGYFLAQIFLKNILNMD